MFTSFSTIYIGIPSALNSTVLPPNTWPPNTRIVQFMVLGCQKVLHMEMADLDFKELYFLHFYYYNKSNFWEKKVRMNSH